MDRPSKPELIQEVVNLAHLPPSKKTKSSFTRHQLLELIARLKETQSEENIQHATTQN